MSGNLNWALPPPPPPSPTLRLDPEGVALGEVVARQTLAVQSRSSERRCGRLTKAEPLVTRIRLHTENSSPTTSCQSRMLQSSSNVYSQRHKQKRQFGNG